MQYKVLIIGPAWVGDMVMAQTLFKLLKSQHGESLILDVFANDWASGLLSRMAEVNQVIPNPFGHGKFELLKRIKVGLELRKNHYDQVFVLPNSIKSAITPFFAKIKRRTGFIGESRYGLLNDIYKLDKIKLPLMIDRFCAIANKGEKPQHIDYPELSSDRGKQLLILNKLGIRPDKPIIAFCPAAEYGPAKRWLPEHFAKLADMLADKNCQMVIMGSNKDTEISNKIINQALHKEQIFDLCGKTNLTEAIDVLAASQHVVTNDSGLMHIACAVGSNVIALYGSSSPNFTPPLSKHAQLLQIKLECSPCFQRTCRFGHYNCLRFITPEMVFSRINLE